MIQLMKINSFINKMIDQQLFIIIIILFSLHYTMYMSSCIVDCFQSKITATSLKNIGHRTPKKRELLREKKKQEHGLIHWFLNT